MWVLLLPDPINLVQGVLDPLGIIARAVRGGYQELAQQQPEQEG
jgi:hypothetical protein